MKKILLLLATIALFGCKNEENKKQEITSVSDYDEYLSAPLASLKEAEQTKEFWSKRLDDDTTGVGDIGPLAGVYGVLFSESGNVENLKHAETLYKKGMQYSANNKDAFARGLARNYISQHRFKEAKIALEESYAGVSKKHETELMLFDVYMELGEYEKANKFLEKVKNPSDYNYLIRLSKWSDYRGDLDAAIKYMEQAKKIAESRNSKELKIWTYSNLGDYYGHAGRIKDAYQHYLMTLKLQPDNAYVKKGIAWITYAAEKDTEEANRILDTLAKKHPVPDYYLFKAELAEYNGDTSKSDALTEAFVNAVTSNMAYGDMYNAYLIEIYADSNPEKALMLAKKEVTNRATPETYHLLALAQLSNGDNKKALETIENYVEGKTYEPMAQYHSALVYKANGLEDKVIPIKEELLEASFELGPVLIREIEKL